MMGAVIEIQFELLHYPISAARKHSFNAIIQQIQILQRGENRPPTAFKRKSIDEGPIQVDEDLTSSEENDTEQPLAKHRKGKVGLYTTTFDWACTVTENQSFTEQEHTQPMNKEPDSDDNIVENGLSTLHDTVL